MRRGELLSLTWGDVDFETRKVWVRSRKQSRSDEFASRDIDMHANLVHVLMAHRKLHPKGQLVFPGPDGGQLKVNVLHRYFKALILATEFDGIGFHCLRHTFASNLARQGVDDRLIDHYMGHQTVEMRRRYQHLFPDKKAAGIHQLTY
jgi:integrase